VEAPPATVGGQPAGTITNRFALVTAPGSGNVGIGTTAPTEHLEVAGGNIKLATPGMAIIFPDNTVLTSATPGTNGGTITGVTAGAGLTGGGIAGGVTLSLNTAVTDALYTRLGASGTPVNNILFGNQTITGDLTVTGTASVSASAITGIAGDTTSTSAFAAGVRGTATGSTGFTFGVHGTTFSQDFGAAGVRGESSGLSAFGVIGRADGASGIGVRGEASSATGPTIGVNGLTSSDSGAGVRGEAISPTGVVIGVDGTTASSTNFTVGVRGFATAATGQTRGVSGVTDSNQGIAVLGSASAATGNTVAVRGTVNSPQGIAGDFVNNNGGLILRARSGSGDALRVFSNGFTSIGGATGFVDFSPIFGASQNTVLMAGLNSATLDGPQMRFAVTGSGNFIDIGQDGSQNFVIETSDVPRLTLLQGGNLGIGTSTPAFPLSVAGIVESTTGGFRFPDGSVQTTAATGGGGGGGRLTIAAITFTQDPAQGGIGGNPADTGQRNANNGLFLNPPSRAFANAALPDGVTVNGFRVCGRDSDDSPGINFTATLKRKMLVTTGGNAFIVLAEDIAVAGSTDGDGASGDQRCFSASSFTNATIDNNTYFYFVVLEAAGTTLEHAAVVIEYQ